MSAKDDPLGQYAFGNDKAASSVAVPEAHSLLGVLCFLFETNGDGEAHSLCNLFNHREHAIVPNGENPVDVLRCTADAFAQAHVCEAERIPEVQKKSKASGVDETVFFFLFPCLAHLVVLGPTTSLVFVLFHVLFFMVDDEKV